MGQGALSKPVVQWWLSLNSSSGGANVHDRRVVHGLALSSGRVVVGMSQEHIVAVPLEEDVPERIKLCPARFRLVNGEDTVDGAERGLALVLPRTPPAESDPTRRARARRLY